MSDMIDMFRGLKAWRQERRRVWGVPCPVCREKLPKAQPKILLPSQVCRAHKPHYRDPRPEEIEFTTPGDPPATSLPAPGSSVGSSPAPTSNSIRLDGRADAESIQP